MKDLKRNGDVREEMGIADIRTYGTDQEVKQ